MGWIKKFFEVDMNHVQRPNLDKNWQSTKGYPRQDVEKWVKQLAEVQRLSSEKGLGYADFQKMRNSTDPNERALGATHHKFYDHDTSGEATNGDHVTLMWNGQSYEVSNNGRHRVQAAKNMSLGFMPAEVTGQEEQITEWQKHGRTTNALMPKDRDSNVRTHSGTQGAGSGPVHQGNMESRPAWERSPAQSQPVRERIDR